MSRTIALHGGNSTVGHGHSWPTRPSRLKPPAKPIPVENSVAMTSRRRLFSMWRNRHCEPLHLSIDTRGYRCFAAGGPCIMTMDCCAHLQMHTRSHAEIQQGIQPFST